MAVPKAGIVNDDDARRAMKHGQSSHFAECSLRATIRWKRHGQNAVHDARFRSVDNPSCPAPQLFQKLVCAERLRKWSFECHPTEPRGNPTALAGHCGAERELNAGSPTPTLAPTASPVA